MQRFRRDQHAQELGFLTMRFLTRSGGLQFTNYSHPLPAMPIRDG